MSEPAKVIPFVPRGQSEPDLTKKQLAAELNVSERWIDYRVAEGMPKHQWTKRMVRFRLGECREWLERRAS